MVPLATIHRGLCLLLLCSAVVGCGWGTRRLEHAPEVDVADGLPDPWGGWLDLPEGAVVSAVVDRSLTVRSASPELAVELEASLLAHGASLSVSSSASAPPRFVFGEDTVVLTERLDRAGSVVVNLTWL